MKYRIESFDRDTCSIEVTYFTDTGEMRLALALEVDDAGGLPSNEQILDKIYRSAPMRAEKIKAKKNALAEHYDRVESLLNIEADITIRDHDDAHARTRPVVKVAHVDAAIAEMEVIPSVTI